MRTDLGAAQLITVQAPPQLRPDAAQTLGAAAPPDWSSVTEGVTTSFNALLLALAAIARVIGCVGIANTTLVAVMERTGEIGLRQALGATPTHIRIQFLAESTAIGAIGGLIGNAIGILTVILVSVSREWTPVIDPTLTVLAPIAGVVTGAVAGLYPAWRASHTQPVQALQH